MNGKRGFFGVGRCDSRTVHGYTQRKYIYTNIYRQQQQQRRQRDRSGSRKQQEGTEAAAAKAEAASEAAVVAEAVAPAPEPARKSCVRTRGKMHQKAPVAKFRARIYRVPGVSLAPYP